MSEIGGEDRRRFLEKLRDALRKAEANKRPAVVFVRCVEPGLQENAAAAIEGAFGKVAWTRLNLAERSGWDRLHAAAQRPADPKQGFVVHRLPLAANGEVERQAVRELERLARWFTGPQSIAVFIVTPAEAEALMDHARTLWTVRSGFFAWPERSRPLPTDGLYGEKAEGARPPPRQPPRFDRGDDDPVARRMEAASGDELLTAAATLYEGGQLDHAGGRAVRAAAAFAAMNDHRGIGEAHHMLGMVAERRGDSASAEGWYDKALESYHRVDGVELEEAMVEERMGLLLFARGDYESAVTLFRRALEKDEARADDQRMAADYRHLALVLDRAEKFQVAESVLQRSLTLEERLNNRAGIARCCIHLGRVGYRIGRSVEAFDHLRRARAICEETGDKAGLSTVFHELGNADLGQGFYPEATVWYEKALRLDRERGDRQALARTSAQIGHVLAESGRTEDALRHLLRSHHLSAFLGHSLARAVLNKIRELRNQLGKPAYQTLLDDVKAEEWMKVAEIPEGAELDEGAGGLEELSLSEVEAPVTLADDEGPPDEDDDTVVVDPDFF